MPLLSEGVKRILDIKNKQIEDLESEVQAAKRLLWLVIHVNGGEVKIPDQTFMMTENNQELECFYDKTNGETIMRSKISIPQLTPSATEPGSL